jgi:hypothetical protein
MKNRLKFEKNSNFAPRDRFDPRQTWLRGSLTPQPEFTTAACAGAARNFNEIFLPPARLRLMPANYPDHCRSWRAL